MALDMPEKTTQAFTAADMRLSVDAVLRMNLNDDSAYEEVQFLPAESRSYPSKTTFMSYESVGGMAGEGREARAKVHAERAAPASAHRGVRK